VNLAQIAPRPKQVLWGVLAASLVCGALAGLAYARTNIPNVSAIAAAQTTTLYYSDGKTPITTIGSTTRTDVQLNQIPKPVQHAVLAAEDRHFYSEPGISPTGMIRALLVDLKGGDISQGGSTITQQYVKNAYLSPNRTLTRKLKEIIIAAKLGQSESKATILDDYLNTIYFGRNAYGIEAAAKAYFNKTVQNLSVSQGALLAAVIRAPSLYDPRVSKSAKVAAQARWQYVVSGMVSQGWLKQSVADKLHFPHTRKHGAASTACQAQECFIRNAVEHELINADGFQQSQLDLGGYKIVTTIDKTAEDALVNAENTVLPTNNSGTPESGAISVVPGDGAIRALYGGREYCGHKKQNPDACIDLSGSTGFWARPPGSSFKLFTLIAALKQGISLGDTFDGPPTVTVDGQTIHNASAGESCYGCTLLAAFAKSVNTVFVPLAKQIDPKTVVKAAESAGIPASRKLPAVPDVTLGPTDVSPLELANAYATVAAQGLRATPYLVKSVTTNNGQHVYTADPKANTEQVFPKGIMASAIYAMTKVLQPGGTAYGRALSGRPSAGKTGTVGNASGQNVDAWFTGFTPQLCTTVWIGNVNRNRPLSGGTGEVFGGTLPAEIWQMMMNVALANATPEPFPTPSAIVIQHTRSPKPTGSPSPTATETVTAKPTKTPTKTPTSKPTPTETITPSQSPTGTPSGGPTKLKPPHARHHQRERH